jgi:acetyl esterase/lipase
MDKLDRKTPWQIGSTVAKEVRMPYRILPVVLALALALAVPPPVGAQDSSGPVGTWYLRSNQSPVTATISAGKTPGSYHGTLIDENGVTQKLDQIHWDAKNRRLEFRRTGNGWWQWYRGTIVEGIFVGRFAQAKNAGKPAQLTAYASHATGWNSTYLDKGIVPRVFNVVHNDNYRTWIRIDAAPGNPKQFTGRLRVYATVKDGAHGEELEYDLEQVKWDGKQLEFTRRDPAWTQHYKGAVQGRTISGTFTQSGVKGTFPWKGTRAQVLTYGLAGKSDADRTKWQHRVRQQLYHLMMAGNPAPLTRKVTVVRDKVPPTTSSNYPPDRDDDPNKWPQRYTLKELQLDYTLPNPYGATLLQRRVHGYLAVPTTKPPKGGKFPALLAVNGHGGSAWQMMNPDSVYFWYGDAFARRGYVVMAVDISHRPDADRHGLYGGGPDDPQHNNGLHPAIKAPGFDSDWVEDGERAWDAMRGLDYLLSRRDVDPKHVVVTGLSMGGEMTTIVGALEPRLAMSIPAGFSPDLGVMQYHGNHECWRWLNADIHEYVDTSDFYCLTAPRPLIIQTGKRDPTYSSFNPPFASDKQVVRRARVAYGKNGPLYHYLHYDEHHWHVGSVNPRQKTERGVRVPVVTNPPTPAPLSWQTDGNTKTQWESLFDAIHALVK